MIVTPAPADALAIEAALRAHPGVADCAVGMGAGDAPGLVAYVVAAAPCDTEELARVAREAARGLPLLGVVQLSALPLTPAGEIDWRLLETFPILDQGLVSASEAAVRRLPGIQDAAVVRRGVAATRRPLHLTDLIPVAIETTATPSAGSTTPDVAEEKDQNIESGQSALIDGGPLSLDADAPATLAASLARAARLTTDRRLTFIQPDGSEVSKSYSELAQDAERVLRSLRSRGLRPGETVLLQLDLIQQFVAAFWGCVLAGAVPVPVALATSYAADNSAATKLKQACEMFGSPLVVASDRLAPSIRAFLKEHGFGDDRVEPIGPMLQSERDSVWHEANPDDVALMMLTSGSTGVPKAVMLSHSNLLSRSAGSRQLNSFSDRDVTLNWMPMDHVAGIIYFHLRDVFLGCRQIHAPTELVLQRPLTWLDWIERYEATITFAPNFAFGLVNEQAEEIARGRWNLSSMRALLNGAEAIVARTARRFLTLLAPHGLAPDVMWPAWGMSETSSGVIYSKRLSVASTTDDDPFVDVGEPIPGFVVRIADAAGQVVKEGTVGRLQVRGTTVTRGYYGRPDLTSAAFTPDGWFDTGDLAIVRRGQLAITGREKDDIVINGVKYYSHEVEGVVDEMPGVAASFTAACAVRRAASDTESMAVFFVPQSAEDGVADLIREIKQRVMKRVGVTPAYVLPVGRDDIPKTSLGKIQRSQLRQQLEAGGFDEPIKQVDLLTSNANTLPDWFFKRTWIPKRSGSPSTATDGVVVVLGELDGLGRVLSAALERGGTRVVATQAASAPSDDYRAVFASIAERGWRVGGVIHLHAYGRPLQATDGRELERDGVLSVLSLAQALGPLDVPAPIRLVVATSQAQAVDEDDQVSLERAAISGLVQTIAQEIPSIDARHVDLAGGDLIGDARRVIDELSCSNADREIAYRSGTRYVPALERLAMSDSHPGDLPFRTGGCYLLTGGLGGIGVEVAALLLRKFEARLVVVGRSVLDAGRSDEPASRVAGERRDALRELEAAAAVGHGAVVYEAGDVADRERMREIVDRARARWGCELDGVIHLAGVFSERLLSEMSRGQFEETLRPKLDGSLVLADLLKGRDGALFVSFSSASSFFGRVGGAAYAAANGLLEAFTHNLRQRGLRAYCLSWSIWDEVGMNRGFSASAARTRGYYAISKAQGISSMLAVSCRQEPVVFVGLDADIPYVARHVAAECRPVERLSAFVVSSDRPREREIAIDHRGHRVSCDLARVEAIPRQANGGVDRKALVSGAAGQNRRAVPPKTDLERLIARAWQDVLQIGDVDTNLTFFDAGGSSLMMAKVYSRLSGHLPRDLSMTEMFRYPTISALAGFLSRDAGASREQESVAQDRDRGRERREKLLKSRRASEKPHGA